MKLYAISDLHLSTSTAKPMDIFGEKWNGHFEKIKQFWQKNVTDEDVVLLGGDLSWAQTLEELDSDINLVRELKGKKVLVRGNHDYWWQSLSKLRNRYPDVYFIQNDAVRFGNVIISGTRGWSLINESSADEDKKIYSRELARLELSLKCAQDLIKKARTEPATFAATATDIYNPTANSAAPANATTERVSDADVKESPFASGNSNSLVDELLHVCVLHYPPFEADFADSAVTALLEKYGVSIATYGHLHGKGVRVSPKLVKNGITYYLTSCDLINNTPVIVE